MKRALFLLLLAFPIDASPRRMAARIVPSSGPYLMQRVPMGSIDQLWAADDGSIWFGGSAGVGRFVPGIGSEIRGRGACTRFVVTADETVWCAGPAIRRIRRSGEIDTFPESADRLAATADGTLFFTQTRSNRIGRITPEGAVTVFDLPPSLVQPGRIIVDRAGDVWFLAHRTLVKMVSDGVYHEIRAAELFARRAPDTSFDTITLGSDGTLFLAIPAERTKSAYATTGGAIVRLTAEGTLVPEADLPMAVHPRDLTAAPDGSFWYYSSGIYWFEQSVVRIRDGRAAVHPTPEESSDRLDQTTALTVDRAGNIWIAIQHSGGGSSIARLIPAP